MTQPSKPCKDCVVKYADFGAANIPKRDASYPGPRCATHWRAEKKRRSASAHESRVADVYGLLPGDYAALLAAQGGTCAIYRCRAAGGSRRLAVEHDHTLKDRASVRGLCCAVHNEWIGRAGDDPAVFDSLAAYLRDPPARRVLTD